MKGGSNKYASTIETNTNLPIMEGIKTYENPNINERNKYHSLEKIRKQNSKSSNFSHQDEFLREDLINDTKTLPNILTHGEIILEGKGITFNRFLFEKLFI